VDPQDGDGGRVQLDPAAAGGGLGPPDREVPAVQVDVRPLQSDQLTDAHARGRGQLIQGDQPVAGHAVKEGAELAGCPGREDAAGGLWRVDEIRRLRASRSQQEVRTREEDPSGWFPTRLASPPKVTRARRPQLPVDRAVGRSADTERPARPDVHPLLGRGQVFMTATSAESRKQ
jgi:hypothetical protein